MTNEGGSKVDKELVSQRSRPHDEINSNERMWQVKEMRSHCSACCLCDEQPHAASLLGAGESPVTLPLGGVGDEVRPASSLLVSLFLMPASLSHSASRTAVN